MSKTQKRPNDVAASKSLNQKCNSKANNNKPTQFKSLPPRLKRTLTELLSGPRTIRELIDRIPTNNPAEYVRQLREVHGLSIPLHKIKFSTTDGLSSWYGVYHLTRNDRHLANRLLGV